MTAISTVIGIQTQPLKLLLCTLDRYPSWQHKDAFLPSLPASPGAVSLCCQRSRSWMCFGWPLLEPSEYGNSPHYLLSSRTMKTVPRSWIMAADKFNSCWWWDFSLQNRSQTCVSVERTECMAANQDRADGWSGHRSTTVCLASGECSSSCLEENKTKQDILLLKDQ